MIFERVKSEGIAHLSYFVGSKSEAVVIDPRRDCQIYIDLARREEMEIKYIFETHRNEDYVIGSLELQHFTGAEIYHGPYLDFKYGEKLNDGQKFHFGTLKLTAIHTPGHTNESTSYSLVDLTVGEEPVMVFTGDTLFVGDVGRTDLYGPNEVSRLAGDLYDSIFNKLLPLGDNVILCPAHGAGSICGGAISQREQSTLGLERSQNPVLQKTKADFIRVKIGEHHERPPNFLKMEQYNLESPPILEHLPSPTPLSPEAFQKKIVLGAVVVDTRMPPSYGGTHIRNSFNIWLEELPSLAGWVLPYDKPILLVPNDKEQVVKVVKYLIRLGYDEIIGYLLGGIEAWYKEALPTEHTDLLTVPQLKKQLESGDNIAVLDVRRKDEWDHGHIEGALNIYVGHLKERLNEVPVEQPIAVICSVGRRASLGASILCQEGHKEVSNVLGGMTAWENAGYAMVK